MNNGSNSGNNNNNNNRKQFKKIAISGGGILGLSLTTAFKAMNNLGKMDPIEKVCGTSVGSMFGVFIACKLNNKEIDYYTEKFYDELTNLPEGVIQQGYNMYDQLGLHDNKNIYKAISQLLYDKYGKHNMTLKEMYEATNIEYTAVTMCMDTRKALYINHKSHPDLEVGTAVQMSAAVPFFFVQVKWHGMVFADGGAVDNMPIDYFDHTDGKFDDETLGLHFLSTGDPERYKADSVLKVLEGIESAQMKNNELQSIQNYELRNIIEIDVGQVDSFNFNLSKKEKDFLLHSGYNSVIAYFAKLDASIKQQKEITKEITKVSTRTWTEYVKSFIW